MAYFRCSVGGGTSINPTSVHNASLTNNATSTYTINSSKHYLVYHYLAYTVSSGKRYAIDYVANGAITNIYTGSSSHGGSVSLSGTTLTLKGTNTQGLYAEFNVVQLD